MKTRIANYNFNAAAKQVVFNDYTSISLDGVLLITNVNSNIIIYNFADSVVGGTVSNNILTLDYDTSVAMNNSDPLIIYYDDLNIAAKDNSLVLMQSQLDMMKRVVKLLESNATVDVSNRQRIAVETIPTVAVTLAAAPTTTIITTGTTATVAQNTNASPYTLGNVTALSISEGPVDQRWRIIDAARTAFANGIRNNLN